MTIPVLAEVDLQARENAAMQQVMIGPAEEERFTLNVTRSELAKLIESSMHRNASLMTEPASKKRKSQIDHIGEFMQLHKAQRMNPLYEPSQEAIHSTPGTSKQADPPPATNAIYPSNDVRFKAADHTANKKGSDNLAPVQPANCVKP